VSRQKLDLRQTATILWRHKLVVGGLVVLGMAGTSAYAVVQPEVYTSTVLVTVAPAAVGNLSTQAVNVTTIPVLASVLRTADLGISLKTLRHRVTAVPSSIQTISISARGSTAEQAERTANAVAESYVAYVGSDLNPGGSQPAKLLRRSTTSFATLRRTLVLEAAGYGALGGAVVALIAALAIWGDDKRLRDRDAIANSIGVPVLASLTVRRPRDVAGWTRLIDSYEPGAADTWQLESALSHVYRRVSGAADGTASTVAVLSLSGDREALAIGPQLATFAAARGIPTALLVSPPDDVPATAHLRAACSADAARGRTGLQLIASPDDRRREPPSHGLTVIVGVVDARTPDVRQTARGHLTLLAVSAAAVSAEQLSRILASAAGAGRAISGVLVANPIPGDETTGRVPQISRLARTGIPTRMVG
jgi:capsular polysaccharide biosynthesis protein